MTTSKHGLILTVVAMAAAVAVGGCTSTAVTGAADTASISYRQVGACNGYVAQQGAGGGGPVGQTGTTSAGANFAYVVFRIDRIDNAASSIGFSFDPQRLENGPDHVDTTLTFAQDLQLAALAPTVIAPGTADTISGFVVLHVQTSAGDGASEANQTKYALNYDHPSGGQAEPGVVFLKENPDQSTWPSTPDCRAITYNGS